MMKNTCSALALAAFLAAAPAFAAVPPEAAPVAALDAGLIGVMKAGSANTGFQARYDMLDPVVKQVMNLPVITQNSVGFLWSTLPAAQQAQLLTAFEQFTVASYVSEFASDGGTQIKLLPAEKSVGARKIVETEIDPADGGASTRIDYVMAEGDQGWQVTDVLLDGTVSQVAVHSSDFSALVSAGDASQLIAALKTKVAALENGTASN
jgi:phospholipid transport system substrate-binding protein